MEGQERKRSKEPPEEVSAKKQRLEESPEISIHASYGDDDFLSSPGEGECTL